MAININDKIGLMKEILPEVYTNHIAAGILVTSPRIANPVIIPPGRCTGCKAPDTEHYELYTKEGVTIWSKRLKPRFVPFDYICDLPGHTFVKFKIKGQNFDIPHGCHDECCVKKEMGVDKPPLAEEFMNSIFAATTGLDVSSQTSQQGVLEIPLPPAPLPPIPELAKEFMNSVSAATTGLDVGTQTQEHLFSPQPQPLAPTVEQMSSPDVLAEQFLNSISAITTGLDVQPKAATPTPHEKEWQDAHDFMHSIEAATTGLDLGSTGHKRSLDRIEEVDISAPSPKQIIIEDVATDYMTDTQSSMH